MRLTLRTLLAYLDGVLTPEQEADIKSQIDSSELASELVHRTGDVVRRPQVGAAEILGLGPIDDPNTMAEYLDGTLPDENVPDFERACLESEVMLAEAASVHRILKQVLDGDVKVDPDTQRRMQALPENLQSLLQQAAEELERADDTKVEELLDKPVVTKADPLPDYLAKEGDVNKELMRWAPAIASLLLLGVTAWIVFGGSGDDMSVGDLPADVAQNTTTPTDSEDQVVPDQAVSESKQEVSETEAAKTDEANPIESASVKDDPQVPEEPSDLPTAESPPRVELEPNEESPEETVPNETTPPVVDPSALTQADQADPMVPVAENSMVPEETTTADLTQTPEAAEEPQEPINSVYRGSDSTLMVIAEEDDTWHRAASEEVIAFDRRIVSLPTYVNTIDIGTNVRMQLIDLSEILLREREDQLTPTIVLEYGKLLIKNFDEENSVDLEFEIDGNLCQVTLAAGEPLAIEIDRPFTPGVDLVNQSPLLQASIYAKGGNVAWEASGGVYSATQAKQWELTEKGEPSDPRDYESDPEWLAGINNNAWDRRASPQLPKRVVTGEEVWPQLQTIVDSDLYKEVRALAAHCSLAVGHPDPIISSFDDEAQQVSWARNLAKLRLLASHNRVEADRIRQTMEEQYGEQLSGDLFVMLCGFSADQIGRTRNEFERGEVIQLIEWLESDSLACRVFAMLNLEEVTGRVGIFDPTASGTRRRQDIRKIRKQLKENELRLEGLDS